LKKTNIAFFYLWRYCFSVKTRIYKAFTAKVHHLIHQNPFIETTEQDSPSTTRPTQLNGVERGVVSGEVNPGERARMDLFLSFTMQMGPEL
jgi:hypothetical protein